MSFGYTSILSYNVSMTRPLILPQSIYLAMLAHARSEFPREACGLLRGRGNRVSGFLAARNVAQTPQRDYQVDAESLLRALAWEDEGDELIAIYHSHPASAAYPSAVDAAKAFYPDSVYLIISLQNRDAPHLQGFFLRAEAIFRDDLARKMTEDLPFVPVRPGLWSHHLPAEAAQARAFRGAQVDAVAFYLIFEDNVGRSSPVVRLISVQPVPLSIRL